jgi:hypothetical protein
MDDFKSLESTMSSQMSELREMIVQIMQTNPPSAPPLPEISATLNEKKMWGWKKRLPTKIKRLGHPLREMGNVNFLIGIPP